MDDILGLQTVRIDGVPPDSHFATMLVEADYRMKRVAIGLETPAVKGMRSHLALIGPGGNTIQRWWFIPCYDSIARSEDGLAFQFIGQRAQLLTQEEVADAEGNRFNAPTTKAFRDCKGFSQDASRKNSRNSPTNPLCSANCKT